MVRVPEGTVMWEEGLEFSLAQFPALAAVEVLTLHVLLTLGAGGSQPLMHYESFESVNYHIYT